MHMQKQVAVANPEGWRGGAAPSEIGQNLAKSAPFQPILASMPPLTDHPGSAPGWRRLQYSKQEVAAFNLEHSALTASVV